MSTQGYRAFLSANELEPIIKEAMIVFAPEQGTTTRFVPEEQRRNASLAPASLPELASLALDVEKLFAGVPQDIEWAWADRKVWLLQSRPVTNLAQPPLTDVRWDPPRKGDKLVRRRRELREAQKQLHPPGMIPEKSKFKFGPFDMSGFASQKKNADDSNLLNGFAVSPGKVTGNVSVILSPADFRNMQPDTILVCPTTTPAWTPLFAQATGLVTDIGGILSHGSIVAREYGIPAVMGTGDLSRRIVSGQRITVDGNAGTVEILD